VLNVQRWCRRQTNILYVYAFRVRNIYQRRARFCCDIRAYRVLAAPSLASTILFCGLPSAAIWFVSAAFSIFLLCCGFWPSLRYSTDVDNIRFSVTSLIANGRHTACDTCCWGDARERGMFWAEDVTFSSTVRCILLRADGAERRRCLACYPHLLALWVPCLLHRLLEGGRASPAGFLPTALN